MLVASWREPVMAALRTRQEARERVAKVFSAALDRVIPQDASKPLKGATFLEFEDQIEDLVRAVVPTLLEERAALEPNASVETPGRCPHCGSRRVYLRHEVTQPEVLSPHGKAVVRKQHARCRACGKSFSPSGSGLGLADGSCIDTAGSVSAGSRGGGAVI
jgi:hypothetical protein